MKPWSLPVKCDRRLRRGLAESGRARLGGFSSVGPRGARSFLAFSSFRQPLLVIDLSRRHRSSATKALHRSGKSVVLTSASYPPFARWRAAFRHPATLFDSAPREGEPNIPVTNHRGSQGDAAIAAEEGKERGAREKFTSASSTAST